MSKWTAPRGQNWEEDIGEDGAEMNKWKNRCKKDWGQVYEMKNRRGRGVLGHREVINGLMRQRAKMETETRGCGAKKGRLEAGPKERTEGETGQRKGEQMNERAQE